MRIERGNFQVVRFCCTSGNCIDCLAGWNLTRRTRVMQVDKLSAACATVVAANWSAYGATVEPMAVPASTLSGAGDCDVDDPADLHWHLLRANADTHHGAR